MAPDNGNSVWAPILPGFSAERKRPQFILGQETPTPNCVHSQLTSQLLNILCIMYNKSSRVRRSNEQSSGKSCSATARLPSLVCRQKQQTKENQVKRISFVSHQSILRTTFSVLAFGFPTLKGSSPSLVKTPTFHREDRKERSFEPINK